MYICVYYSVLKEKEKSLVEIDSIIIIFFSFVNKLKNKKKIMENLVE